MFPEGSYEIESFGPSVHPSFHLSVSFLGIGSLAFSETFLDPYVVACDKAEFFGKNLRQTKLTKNDQNDPKTGFLNFY